MLALLRVVAEIDDPEFIVCAKQIKLKYHTVTQYCLTELPAYVNVTNKILFYEPGAEFDYSNSLVLQNPVLQSVNISMRIQGDRFSWALIFVGA